MKSFFYVESTHRIKTIDCMWNIQCMSFYVENLHRYNNFIGRVYRVTYDFYYEIKKDQTKVDLIRHFCSKEK